MANVLWKLVQHHISCSIHDSIWTDIVMASLFDFVTDKAQDIYMELLIGYPLSISGGKCLVSFMSLTYDLCTIWPNSFSVLCNIIMLDRVTSPSNGVFDLHLIISYMRFTILSHVWLWNYISVPHINMLRCYISVSTDLIQYSFSKLLTEVLSVWWDLDIVCEEIQDNPIGWRFHWFNLRSRLNKRDCS